MEIQSLNLSDRQKLVLQCVIDAANENKQPFTVGVVRRMKAKGYEITEKQCAYDLGVIIRTKDTHVYSMKFDNNPKLWIYEAPKKTEVNS
ncbi:MAG: hypothetical protein GAK29_01512 [Acinetobacter bereziniae]|uniref:Uncharacterized protein n=1 Tax=Acinetobacter bereziniae TaxID=106648 RepID=A0A833PGL5_ACIBZ|nr:MAG: hypothetical protein GAK29_01512 [Acinetobacter bereziniae]